VGAGASPGPGVLPDGGRAGPRVLRCSQPCCWVRPSR